MSPRRPKMPVFDENAPLPTHRPKYPLSSKDADGFLVPAVPAAKRLRPLSVNINTGKKVVPKYRGGSVSLSKGTGGVIGYRKEEEQASKTEVKEDSFWGDVSMMSQDLEEKKKDDGLAKLEKRVKVVELGLKASLNKTAEKFQTIESTLTDIQTELLLRTQAPSLSTTASSLPTPLESSVPFPDSPIRLPPTNRLISEFGEYNPAGYWSPPVPALLSKRRKEMAMRRMSGLSRMDEGVSGCDISVDSDNVSARGDVGPGEVVVEIAELEGGAIAANLDGINDVNGTIASTSPQYLTVEPVSSLDSSEHKTLAPRPTVESRQVVDESEGKEMTVELDRLKELVKVLEMRVDQQDTNVIRLQAEITFIRSQTQTPDSPSSYFHHLPTCLVLLAIAFLAIPYLPHTLYSL